MSRVGIYNLKTGKLEKIIAEGHSLVGNGTKGKGLVDLPDDFDEATHECVFGEVRLSEAKAREALRAERDRRLAACDYPPLYERPDAEQPAWKAYRQALRDLPDTVIDPFNPEWPTQPQKPKETEDE